MTLLLDKGIDLLEALGDAVKEEEVIEGIYTRDGLRASLESSGGMRRDNNKPAGCFHSAGISFHAVYAAFRIRMNSSPVMVSCSYR